MALDSAVEAEPLPPFPSSRPRPSELQDFTDAPALTRLERAQIRFVRSTFEPGRLSEALVYLQRVLGSRWIEICTSNVREIYGMERFPRLARQDSLIVVSNHRSFFDMYMLTGYLVRRGLPLRLLFPVRSNFFYDSPMGLFVNGVMSFFAMYPPIFRERSRRALNLASLDETIRLVQRGGTFLGLHPEGTRNQGDPYTPLPAQRGVGRIIHECPRARVVPVFVNGLDTNDIKKQVRGNFDGTGERCIGVFGSPIDFGDLMQRPGSPKLHKQISELAMSHIMKLAEEEKTYRAMPRPPR